MERRKEGKKKRRKAGKLERKKDKKMNERMKEKRGRGKENKAGYTAIQSRTVGQEQWCENRSQFKNVTDGQTDRPTDTARCRVACPRLKRKWKKKVIRPKSRAFAFHQKLDRRTDWSSQNDPQISILYLPVRVEIRFDYQSPVILCRNKWCAKK